jgi:hypothetical protein
MVVLTESVASMPSRHARAYPSRVIVADCSCGGIYIVPQGEDEYDALQTAHRAHVKLMRQGC